MIDRSTQNSRAQSPILTPQRHVNRHPYITGGLIGAAATVPLTLLAHHYRAPIGKFTYNFGNYLKRAGYNMYDAVRKTPWNINAPQILNSNESDYKKNHVNTVNEKQYR